MRGASTPSVQNYQRGEVASQTVSLCSGHDASHGSQLVNHLAGEDFINGGVEKKKPAKTGSEAEENWRI